ncbi:MAG: cytochrome C oxidase subunit IV family protein [Phycisphaeraceae bacterium]
MITHSPPRTVPASRDIHHGVPLLWLFVALLCLTAAEVGLFEIWHRTGSHQADGSFEGFIPKYALVLLILVFTIPKALIVLIYFMHLKFERQLVVSLAIVPFVIAFLAVLTPLVDAAALFDRRVYRVDNSGGPAAPHTEDAQAGHGEAPASDQSRAAPPPSSNMDY